MQIWSVYIQYSNNNYVHMTMDGIYVESSWVLYTNVAQLVV